MSKKIEIEKRKIIFDDFFAIEEVYLKIEKPDGAMSSSIRILNFERGDSVAILIWNSDLEKAILAQQFRYPTYKKGMGWMVELVAGMLEEGEKPEEAVRREVDEEIGFRTDDVEHISTFFLSPGGSSERIWLYYAKVKNEDKIDGRGGGLLEENEYIDMVEYTLDELMDGIQKGEIMDAKTIIAAMWLQRKLEGK